MLAKTRILGAVTHQASIELFETLRGLLGQVLVDLSDI